MSTFVQSIELDGLVDTNHHLILENEDLPLDGPTKVKVVITPFDNTKSKSVYGFFKSYAKPELIEKEDEAWRDAAVKKYDSH